MEMNCKGQVSPQPILFVREVLDTLEEGDDVVVLLDNPRAAADLIAFARSEGFEAEETGFKGDDAVRIVRSGTAEKISMPVPKPEKSTSFILTINSSRFGQGNPRLGESLMQSFVYALTKEEPLPDAILFMNAGVNLVCEDSALVKDLQVLSEEGVHILVDEASLNFYGLRDAMKIGVKKDMMEITSILLNAERTLSI